MLVVTDNGVQVLLKRTAISNKKLRDALLIAGLLLVNGILSLGLSIYPTSVALSINFLIFAFSLGLQVVRKRHQPVVLSGGDIVFSAKAFKHIFLGKTTQYQLTQNDTVQMQGDCLQIRNSHNKMLYQIGGFTDTKQLQVAQAVLQGKSIKTQGKTIKMQSD